MFERSVRRERQTDDRHSESSTCRWMDNEISRGLPGPSTSRPPTPGSPSSPLFSHNFHISVGVSSSRF